MQILQNLFKSKCPRKSKLVKLPNIDFLLPKHIEGYLYDIEYTSIGLLKREFFFEVFNFFKPEEASNTFPKNLSVVEQQSQTLW